MSRSGALKLGVRLRAGLGLLALAGLLGGVTSASPSEAEGNAPAEPAGNATAVGAFGGYSDQDTFFTGSPTQPPNSFVPYATSGFDNTGTGLGTAALAFNPYSDAPGAINGVAPPGTPQVPAGDLRGTSRAEVSGRPPQDKSVSVSPEGSPALAGRVRAALEDAGPAAVADAVTTAGNLADQIQAHGVHSTTRVALQGGKAVSTAATVIDDVGISGVLTIRSVVLSATSTADDVDGPATATANVFGVAVNGTAVELTDQGVVVGGQATPLATAQVRQALARAGIEILAPGGQTVHPGAKASMAEARGPSIRLKSNDGRRVDVTLGVVTTSSIIVGEDQPVLDVTPPAESSFPASNSSLTPGASGGIDAGPLPAPTQGSHEVVSRSGGSPTTEAEAVPEAAVPGSEARSSGGSTLRAMPPVAGTARSAAVSRVAAETLWLSRLLYGLLALIGGGLFLAGLVAPRGETWAAKG